MTIKRLTYLKLLVVGIMACSIAIGGLFVGSLNAPLAGAQVDCGTPTPTPTASASPSPTPTGSGVQLKAGASLSTAIANYPAGMRFDLAAGTYKVTSSLVPKDRQSFVGAPGALLTGSDSTPYAFTGSAKGVQIHGLIVEHFKSAKQEGAISSKNATGWLIESNEIRHNAAGGIYAGPGTHAIGNYVHHNHQIGIKAKGADIAFEDNEVAFNNWLKEYSYGWEAGGSKFWSTTNLVLRGNDVHDNWGPGLWTDHDNTGTLIEGNTVTHNADAGIFHEISYSATIRNNTITQNGYDRGDWLWGSGIQIASSGGTGIDIYGNTLDGNANAIGLIQQNRGSGNQGTYLVQNVRVHDNVIKLSSGHSGAVQDVGSNAIFTSRNNRFDHNTYTLGSVSKPFYWNNGARAWSEWSSIWPTEVKA
jgi:parallel beta-helix repeat protein